MVFRRRSEEYSFEPIRPDEVDELVNEIVKSGASGFLSKRDFLKRAMGEQESTITIVAKKKNELKGVVNGIAIKEQPLNPQINFVWVKDAESSMRGLPRRLIDKFVEEAKKRKPKASSVDISLPTFDVNSIALYSFSGFVIEGFIRGPSDGPDIVIMRRGLEEKPPRTPVV